VQKASRSLQIGARRPESGKKSIREVTREKKHPPEGENKKKPAIGGDSGKAFHGIVDAEEPVSQATFKNNRGAPRL